MSMSDVENEFEKLNDRKKHYNPVDDDTIQSLIHYFKLENDNDDHHKHVVRFAKDADMKGDTFD